MKYKNCQGNREFNDTIPANVCLQYCHFHAISSYKQPKWSQMGDLLIWRYLTNVAQWDCISNLHWALGVAVIRTQLGRVFLREYWPEQSYSLRFVIRAKGSLSFNQDRQNLGLKFYLKQYAYSYVVSPLNCTDESVLGMSLNP